MRCCGVMLAAVAVLVAGLSSSWPADAACTLRIGWEPYVPYSFAGEDGTPTGADIELMRHVADAIGCDPLIRELPWARQLLELRSGALDVAMSASWTAERAEFVHFSIPYRQSEMAIYVRAGTAPLYPLGSLGDIPQAGFRLGVISGYYYGDEFEDLEKDPSFAAHVDPAADYRTNIMKLLHERIDGLLVDDVAVVRAEAKALGALDLVEPHPLHIPGDAFHLMLSRASIDSATVAAINAHLEKMRADGSLEAIMERFLK